MSRVKAVVDGKWTWVEEEPRDPGPSASFRGSFAIGVSTSEARRRSQAEWKARQLSATVEPPIERQRPLTEAELFIAYMGDVDNRLDPVDNIVLTKVR